MKYKLKFIQLSYDVNPNYKKGMKVIFEWRLAKCA